MKHYENDDVANLLAAYALGALDVEEMVAVERLIASSAERQEELRRLREVVALLPYTARPVDPPQRVQDRLMARIAADQASQAAPASPPAPAAQPAPAPAASRPPRRWLGAFAAVAAALLLGLGALTASLGASVARLEESNRQLASTIANLERSQEEAEARQAALFSEIAAGQEALSNLSAQLEASQAQITQLSGALQREQYVVSFVSAPGVATRELSAVAGSSTSRGEMYMYPGEEQAVVLFSGLPALSPGQVYQFWLADGATQVAGGTFLVDERGIATLVVEAPREVNAFQEVMVTIEPDGGSARPSELVVLEGSL